MGKRLIPRQDLEFKTKAMTFSRAIADNPQRFGLRATDAQELQEAYERYHAAYQATQFGKRSEQTSLAKREARAELEKRLKRCMLRVRSADNVGPQELLALGMSVGPAKRTAQTCPQEPPKLRFVRALHEGGGATPMHELAFTALDMSKSRPAGAVRLELFVDLIPPEEPIPRHPGANHGGRPWYLRSYTRNPIVLAPPMARVPMRVVYWGRWADSTGNVGPFSATCAAWIEGGTHHALPGGMFNGRNAPPILEDAAASGPAREQRYRVALVEVRCASMLPQEMGAMLPAPEAPEPRRLEAPPASEAA